MGHRGTNSQVPLSVVHSLHLFHQLGDDMQPVVRNDPQQLHQVFMLQLPEKEQIILNFKSLVASGKE